MKRFITMTTAAALLSGPALAGSLEAPAPEPVMVPAAAPVAPASPDWTGFYGGVQLGYGDIGSNVAGLSGDGFVGGVNAGYDYDLGNWVVGGGLSYDYADISLGGGSDLESIWRAKARVGYKIGDGLLYGAGGWAYADTNNLGSEDGYFVGAGYEHMLANNLTIGGEVLYHEFGNFGPSSTTDVDATTYQIRATYRF